MRAGKLPLTGGAARHTVRSLLCVLDLGVSTRGPRIAWAAMHTRACAATRLGTPYLMIVAPHGLRLPDAAGDEHSPWRSGAALLWRDAATEEECVETWEGGGEQREERG